MKTLFITSNKKNHQSNIFGVTEIYEFKNLNDTCAYIRKNEIDVLVVIAEDKFEGGSNEWGGLELLILLRLENIRLHFVVFSFYNLKQLMSKTKLAYAIGTQCVSFYQLPIIGALQNKFTKLKDKTSTIRDLKRAYYSIIDITQFRHEFGNVWGLNILIDAYNQVFDLKGSDKIKKANSTIIGHQFNFKLGKYLSYVEEVSPDEKYINIVKSSINSLQYIRDKKILYIDDKANDGWVQFLKLFFNDSIQFITLQFEIDSTLDTLFEQVIEINNDHTIEYIISDLRLLKEDNYEANYLRCTGFQLLSKIYSYKEEDNLVFGNVPFMYFTASNNTYKFFKILNMLAKKPSSIYIKQNFDIQESTFQKFDSFKNLLIALRDLVDDTFRIRRTSIWDEDLDIASEIEKFETKIESTSYYNKINLLQNKIETENYDLILLDTNIYFLDEPIPALIGLPNLKMLFPVYKEMTRIKNSYENSDRKVMAHYFLENIDEEDTIKAGLSDNDILETNNAIAQNKTVDIIDNYIVQMVKYLANSHKILFISNDVNDKNGIPSPVNALREWQKVTNSNLKVETYGLR